MRSEIIHFELYLWNLQVQIRSRIGVNPNLTDFFLGSRESGVGSGATRGEFNS
ncbi:MULTISPECIES: hypothetical protein [Moorena]|uniref:hypothetical protein n=1 Tax=Moorena TaxID=1155738 RepID=UPI000316965C|nr:MULTISPECIES: hypothetical protein [Moorena]NEP31906.1 hypothetical protein [Moorena sp. SIO3B2]NEP67066.1 hypothetical protein [Moorena sp. SIO3A5]NEQ08529.1 hypothetical protein [Moorena sp. SIO4E2]NER88840.1 hypothetical protein [Moorena sp. SIO3A2]